MTDEERIINRLQNLAIEKCLDMENCQDIADVYEKHFCKKKFSGWFAKGGAHGELGNCKYSTRNRKDKS